MIAGRPTNLWLGLATAIQGAIAVSAIAIGADPAIVGTLSGAWGAVFGAIILVVAGQPPTVNPGDDIKITTPKGEATATITAPTP